MPAARMEIIFDTSDDMPNQIVFDVSVRNARYVDHRNAGTAERLKIAADIERTAVRKGFDYIPSKMDADGEMIPLQRFVSAYPYAAADPRAIVEAFRDQGYDVVCRGGYKNGRILSWDEICGMSFDEHRRVDREEAAYAAGRAAERDGRDAAAVLRLKAAALAEADPETGQIRNQEERDAIRARQARDRDQVRGLEVSEERQIAFAA